MISKIGITGHFANDACTLYRTRISLGKKTNTETGQQYHNFTFPAAWKEIAKVNARAKCMVNENIVKKLNVRELKKIFEELSKEQNHRNYKRWSEDYDLLLKRKRVKLLRRLIMEKEHPEKFNGRHRLLKSSSAPSCPNDIFMGKLKDSLKRTEISEDDQYTIEKLYDELELYGMDLQRTTSSMPIKYSTSAHLGYDVEDSGLPKFSREELLSQISRDITNKVEGSISLPSKVDDSFKKPRTATLSQRSAGSRPELGLVAGGSDEELALSKNGNDECLKDDDATNTDILALCRKHKLATCTAVTSFLGFAMILAFTYLKLKK